MTHFIYFYIFCRPFSQCIEEKDLLSALMQLPSANRLRLMWAPSTILLPRFCVLAARSDPARSMRNSLPTRTCWWIPVTRWRCLTDTISTACDRDEVLLAAVGSWVLSLLPPFKIDITFTDTIDQQTLGLTMGRGIKGGFIPLNPWRPLLPLLVHPVPERVKSSFVIFNIRALWRSGLSVRVLGCQKLQINPVWYRMLYSCTYMITMGVKGLKCFLISHRH